MDNGLLNGISHMKQSTIKLKGSSTVYFDPYDIAGEPMDADVIFISHSHYDHFSIGDIRKIMKKDTILVLPEECVKDASKAGMTNITAVLPSGNYEAAGLRFSTVPAYNIRKLFHKKRNRWVGYVVNINDAKYYFAGDTDCIPEMNNIEADVAFLPVGGTYTMNWREAVDAANMINPKIAVPIHFKDIVGTVDDAVNFTKGIHSTIQGVILKTQ